MDKLLIQGGKRLAGDITISGAKNAALPILCAGLLTAGKLELSNVPRLHDVATMLKLLGQTGLKVAQDDECVTLQGDAIDKLEAPYELVKTMRASILVLGPLLARFGEARCAAERCAIGSPGRPAHQACGAGRRDHHRGGYIYAMQEAQGRPPVTDMVPSPAPRT